MCLSHMLSIVDLPIRLNFLLYSITSLLNISSLYMASWVKFNFLNNIDLTSSSFLKHFISTFFYKC